MQMPKGALLHVHLDATVNAQVLLDLALEHEIMHVRTTERVTSSSISKILPEFRPIAALQASSASLTDATYASGDWVPLSKARQDFAPDLGGPHGFDKWFIESLTISPSQAYRTHNTSMKVIIKPSLCMRLCVDILLERSGPSSAAYSLYHT